MNTAPTPATNPYGNDFWIGNVGGARFLLDADPSMRIATGIQLLAQSLVCRQMTPRGSVIDCPNDCINLLDYVAAGMTSTQMLQLYSVLQAEILKDQRVLSGSTVTGSYSFQTGVLTINESIQSSFGPFALVLPVSLVTGQLLNANLLAGN